MTLKAARRLALLALARAERIAIIEDDYDHEFHYDGRPVLPLASADHSGLVVYIGTLSKILAPGFRIGYIVAPPAVLHSVGAIRSLLDIQGDLATEATIATLIEDGELQRHVARVRRVYANRREILANSLRRTFGDGVEFTLAGGGMALWVHLRMAVDFDAVGPPQHRARRLVVHGPPLHVRRPAHTLCAIQLCLAERARAAGSGQAHGRGAPVAPIRNRALSTTCEWEVSPSRSTSAHRRLHHGTKRFGLTALYLAGALISTGPLASTNSERWCPVRKRHAVSNRGLIRRRMARPRGSGSVSPQRPMRHRRSLTLVCIVAMSTVLAVASGPVAQGPNTATTVNWPLHNLDLAGSRFSTLDQINPSNVKSLTPRWLFQHGVIDGVSNQTTPMIVDGVMYVTDPRGSVYAVNAADGHLLWTYDVTRLHWRRSERGLHLPQPRRRAMPTASIYTAGGIVPVRARRKDREAAAWLRQERTGQRDPGRHSPAISRT